MAVKQFLTLINGVRTLVEAITSSAGVADADKIVATGSGGYLDASLLPPGVGPDVKVVTAFHSIDAGDFVTVFDDGGTPKIRLADASDGMAGQAHGFVLDSYGNGDPADVYFLKGRNNQLVGLSPGVTYALSSTTPGAVVALSSVTTGSGDIVQVLGVASSATELEVSIDEPVEVQ